MRTALHRKLRRAALWCHASLLLRYLGTALVPTGLVWALAITAQRLLALSFPSPWMLWPLLGLAAVATLGFWLRRRPRLLEVAVLVDQRFCLRETLSTGLALAASREPFAVAACLEAERLAGGLEIGRKFHLRAERVWLYSLSSWLLAGVVVIFLPAMDLLGQARRQRADQEQARKLQQARVEVKQAAQQVKATVSRLNDPALEGELAKLDQSAEALRPEELRRQAIRKLEDLGNRIQKAASSQRLEPLRELQEALKGLRPSPQGLSNELNRALAKGDFKSAAAMLKDLQSKLDEGKLSEEQRQALAKQLQDLAKQLEALAARQSQLEEELEKLGLDKGLAKLDERKLREMLEQQGLGQDKIEELMKKAASCRAATAMCSRLGQAMAVAGDSCTAGAGDLGQLLDRLDEIEALKAELALTEASLEEIRRTCACLGCRQGQGFTGPFMEGAPMGAGPGTGAPGIGYGPRTSDDSGDTAFRKTRVQSPPKEGPAVASYFFKGQQVKGESRQELKEIIKAAKDGASEAINDNEIPRRYEAAVKQYFGQLEESGKGGQ